MTEPVCKLYLSRPTESWYELPREKRLKKLEQLDDLLKSVGGSRIIQCDATWASDEWPFWGVEKFPNLEAAQEYAKLIRGEGVDWLKYASVMSVLGTEDL